MLKRHSSLRQAILGLRLSIARAGQAAQESHRQSKWGRPVCRQTACRRRKWTGGRTESESAKHGPEPKPDRTGTRSAQASSSLREKSLPMFGPDTLGCGLLAKGDEGYGLAGMLAGRIDVEARVEVTAFGRTGNQIRLLMLLHPTGGVLPEYVQDYVRRKSAGRARSPVTFASRDRQRSATR